MIQNDIILLLSWVNLISFQKIGKLDTCYESRVMFRDGPLENLRGERAKYQKNIRPREN